MSFFRKQCIILPKRPIFAPKWPKVHIIGLILRITNIYLRSYLPGQHIFFFLAGYHAQGHDLKRFGKFCETIFTPKEWFLSKKGPKEGERVARGHFHERVGETPVHWLPPGVGPTPKPFSVSENRPFENFLRSNSIFIQ